MCRHNMCAALTVCVCVCVCMCVCVCVCMCVNVWVIHGVIKCCHGAVRYCTWRSWKGLK